MATRWAQRVAIQRPRSARQMPVQIGRADVARQTKVGPADDRYERQADAVAARVVGTLQRGGSASEVATTDTPTVQRQATGAIGPEGGAVDTHVQSALDRTRGGGLALAAPVRRSMEGAFGGVDFGGVRIHSGAESADLNARLGARAFTVGSDIYMGAGAPSLSGGGGTQLLAHELTHTLQQSGGAQRSVLRRLSVDKPLKNITSIDVMQRGASGAVANVSDGSKPVIVKANQANAAEVMAADKMQRQGKFKSGSYKVKAPKSRLATNADKLALTTAAQQNGVLVAPDPRNFITGLAGAHPTIIAEAMEGDALQKTIDGMVTSVQTGTKKNSKGKDIAVMDHTRHDKEIDDVKQLVKKTAPMKVLAKATASDVAMGASDRLIGLFNAENFNYDPAAKRFFFVDNTVKDSPGALTSRTGANFENARAAFDAWARLTYPGQLASNPAALAQRIVGHFTGLNADGSEYSMGFGLIAKLLGGAANAQNDKTDVRDELKAIITANYAGLLQAAEDGLKSGRDTALKSLANPLSLTKGLTGAPRQEAVTSLLARRNVLKGMTGSAAWSAAHTQALKLLKMTNQPEQLPMNSLMAQNFARDNAHLLA